MVVSVLCHFFSCPLVFQSKVFQKLYPAPPKREKELSPPGTVDALSRKPHVKGKASQRETATGEFSLTFGIAIYTLTNPQSYMPCQNIPPLLLHMHWGLLLLFSVSGDAGRKPIAANPGRRMYTVLPPPADHKTDSEKSVTLPQLESVNSADDPAGKAMYCAPERFTAWAFCSLAPSCVKSTQLNKDKPRWSIVFLNLNASPMVLEPPLFSL